MGTMFKAASQRKTIKHDDWPEGMHVVIKKFTWGDEKRIESVMLNPSADVSLSGEQDEITMQTKFDLYGANMLKMKLGIASWTFNDEGGNVAPITMQSINNLDKDVGDFILNEIEKFNPDYQVSASQVERAEKRVASNQEYLERLQEDPKTDPAMLEVAEKTLIASQEYLAELEEKRAEQREFFP